MASPDWNSAAASSTNSSGTLVDEADPQHPILFYDGVCGLCDRLVQFTLRRDKNGAFRFSTLQSKFAQAFLQKHDENAAELNNIYIAIEPGTDNERLLVRARAALHVARVIGGVWKVFLVFGVLPTGVLDFFYGAVAKRRYKIFGRHDSCRLPDPQWKDRFITDE